MRDQISIARVATLHPKVRQDFTSFIEEAEEALNITLRVSQGFRSFEEQAALYALGRSKPGKIVTNAKPGSSWHQYGLAVDLVEMNDKAVDWGFDMSKLLPYAAKHGITWGGHFPGSFKDYPHWEKKVVGQRFLHLQGVLAQYVAKDFIPGTQYVNL